jgi:hypothetical protein
MQKYIFKISNGYRYVDAATPSGFFNNYNEMYNYNKKKEKIMLKSSIVNVIFNDPATIIFWSDGTKTIVKCKKIQKRCREGRYPGSMKVDGKWMIPYSGFVKDDLNGK